MKVTIYGSGYVGLVTGACLAEVGNEVLCVDVDPAKVESLNRGEVPIYEPGLDRLIARGLQTGRLAFTTDPGLAVSHGLFQFIAVGTPPDEDGSADLSHVLEVARSIASRMEEYRIVINKSTVPVGTRDLVKAEIQKVLAARGKSFLEFDVVANPEFLKEGAAVDDFMRPDRIIIGTDNPRATELLKALYAPFNRNHERVIVMDAASAELTKYAANAMLATKISLMNELAGLAERLGADIEKVRVGIGADPRIGYHFIYPGCGYGGSCFPKDIKALGQMAKKLLLPAEILTAVDRVNERQKRRLYEKIRDYYHGDLKGKVFALWGLAFKPNTDDMREAPSRVLMEALWEAGAKVQAYDPKAKLSALRIYGERCDLILSESPMAALEDADGLALLTEWNEFRSPDFSAMKQLMRRAVIFDGRNLYDPALVSQYGFDYLAIGRPEIKAATCCDTLSASAER
jgi:UDPglucose 6-dehydrogenase